MKTILPLYQLVAALTLPSVPLLCSAAADQDKPHSAADTPAPAKTDSGPDNLQFGPVTELVLSSDLAGKDYLLDLDTGRVLSPVQDLTPKRLFNPALGLTFQSSEMAWRAYLFGLGVDLVNEAHLTGLAGCDLASDPVGREKWNSLSAAELARKADQLWQAPKPLQRSTLTYDHDAPPPHAATFMFRTREGSRGILQITEIKYQPKKVKIRYKLVLGSETSRRFGY